MKHKILVADDSLTIQKVIKITLASEPFELFECTDASELNNSIDTVQPNIVLLDFNLSEDKTGYDLAQSIKSKLPNTKILMLFGTFDTIDEGLLNSSGVNHKIVKPFDGTKFINLCRVMAEDLSLEKSESLSTTEESFSMEDDFNIPGRIDEVEEVEIEVTEEEAHSLDVDDLDDGWVMDGPEFDDEEEEVEIEVTHSKAKNALEANISDWGMDVPGIIGGGSNHFEMPDIIMEGPTSEREEASLPNEDDLAFPDANDLEFPDADDLAYPDEIKLEEKPKLVPLESFDTEPVVHTEIARGGTETDDDLANLKAELEDELEEEDLWAADEVIESETTSEPEIEEESDIQLMNVDDLPHIEPHNLHEVVESEEEEVDYDFDAGFDSPSDFPADVMADQKPKQPAAHNVNLDQLDLSSLEDKIKERLTPMVEELVREYCREQIEKIAWEVIPDLAENLMKKELKAISEQILNS